MAIRPGMATSEAAVGTARVAAPQQRAEVQLAAVARRKVRVDWDRGVVASVRAAVIPVEVAVVVAAVAHRDPEDLRRERAETLLALAAPLEVTKYALPDPTL